uniref:Uncharacterized protein n=1 Tax=Nelumbo nucifera TaxID=4432 RepID=A0A822YE74_NELNU|nr:TPA_asm: hypothetical protein HUJ06_009638 [Nelumbo nucifera]
MTPSSLLSLASKPTLGYCFFWVDDISSKSRVNPHHSDSGGPPGRDLLSSDDVGDVNSQKLNQCRQKFYRGVDCFHLPPLHGLNSDHLYPSSPTKVTFRMVIVFVFSGKDSKDRLLSSSSPAKAMFPAVIVFVFSGKDNKDRKNRLCLRFRQLLSSDLKQQGQAIVFVFSSEGNVSSGFISQ